MKTSRFFRLFLPLFTLNLGLMGCAVAAPSPLVVLHPEKPRAFFKTTLPRRARSLRFVSAPAGTGNSRVYLHFYGVPATAQNKPSAGENLSEEALNIVLEVWAPRARGRWRRLRAIPLGFCDDFSWQNAELRWLDAKRKTGPIVLVPRSEATELIALPAGWTQKTAVRQVFSRSTSSISALFYEFDATDARGLFSVTEVASERKEGGSDDTPTPLLWTGKGWSAAALK